MADLWKTVGRRGVGAGHVDDRGYGNGAAAGNTPQDRRRAVRAVAHHAHNASEAVLFLSMLDLTAGEGIGEGNAA
jgi:hypothetical protein